MCIVVASCNLYIGLDIVSCSCVLKSVNELTQSRGYVCLVYLGIRRAIEGLENIFICCVNIAVAAAGRMRKGKGVKRGFVEIVWRE